MQFNDKLTAKFGERRKQARKDARAPKESNVPSLKVTNLASTTSGAMIKESLESWGINGITNVTLDEEDSPGPTALLSFKTKDDAEFAMQADGIEVDRRRLTLELVANVAVAPPARPGNGNGNASPQADGSSGGVDETDTIRVLGVPMEATRVDVTTFLRQYGVLGIVGVELPEDEKGHAYVQFQDPDNVKSALSKVPQKALFRGKKVTLEAVPAAPPVEEHDADANDVGFATALVGGMKGKGGTSGMVVGKGFGCMDGKGCGKAGSGKTGKMGLTGKRGPY